eukprot:TRINITY_DN10089_c0_g1_i1.p1 TRINITY_DN10089_c0_g1~~TRINITY_DN10089_c0_g1_i1.p1  ORF type:complete len:64 (+),score=23.31 TRINITY_DN10089_c0_g1_i1:147-338(+)
MEYSIFQNDSIVILFIGIFREYSKFHRFQNFPSSRFFRNMPYSKKKKYRLRGRSSETAKAHRG